MQEREAFYPTHHCFDDVVDFLNNLAVTGACREELLEYTVVHGVYLAPPNGEPVAHAWLERAGLVVQAGIYKGERIYYSVPREEFLAMFKIWDETRYTVIEALELDSRMGRPPWVPEYRELCGTDGKVWVAGRLRPR